MSIILAGHVQLLDQATAARAALWQAAIPDNQISTFYVSQPGQHDQKYVDDHYLAVSDGAKQTPRALGVGIAIGGVIGASLGVATTPVTGPVGPIVGALVGAHIGSLFSFTEMKEAGEVEPGSANEVEPRVAGMMVAVAVATAAEAPRVVDILRQIGADHIERSEGEIRNGDWVDFDPLSSPHPVN